MLDPLGNGVFAVSGLELPDLSGAPLLLPGRTDPAANVLRHALTKGNSNGFKGVAYDNRDGDHSRLSPKSYPALARLKYGDGVDRSNIGLGGRFRFPAVVIGNSSTAITGGPRRRSLPRLAMTQSNLARQSYALYINNHLYLYPEHRDHDAIDLYPANWPFMVISQGSSGSDKAFLHTFAMTIAALPEDTMQFLRSNGLVAPTLQMILRRNLLGVDRDAEYYGAEAHPTVFDPADLRPERMIGQAAALTPEAVSPMVRLSVTTNDFQNKAGLFEQSEVLFETPAALAYLWRGFEGRKRLTVSAGGTRDPLGRGVRFRWVLLRGDKSKVQIEPSDDTTSAEIVVDWHDSFTVPGPEGPMKTSRVDIGVFTNSGPQPSAPSMISISFPTHQKRTYEDGHDGEPVLLTVDYDAVARQAAYDPALYWTADWTDSAVRDDQGSIVAWDRYDGASTHRIPADGTMYRIEGEAGALPTLFEVDR
ncbi:MAG: hypothetical protein AAGO57_06765 [Pseudomonadota bacterium]